MAFNINVKPKNSNAIDAFRNKKLTNESKDDVATYDNVPVETLESSGVKTDNLINNSNYDFNNDNLVKVNYKTISLDRILVLFNGKTDDKKVNKFLCLEKEIVLKPEEFKWFDITNNKGSVGAFSLTKHLLSIQKGLTLEEAKENSDSLFQAAKKLIDSNLTQLTKPIQKSNPVEAPPTEENASSNTNIENPKPSLSVEERKAKERAIRNFLNDIPLSDLFTHLGANSNEDGESGKWKFYQTGHNIGIFGNGQQFKNWNTLEGGSGAIQFMKQYFSHVENIYVQEGDKEADLELYKKAFTYLLEHFGEDIGDDFEYDAASSNNSLPVTYKIPFALPLQIPFKVNEVRDYLHLKRGLPYWVIDKQIKSGLLYPGYPSDWPYNPKINSEKALKNTDVWAVFLGVNGNAAEMRNIGGRTDGFAKMNAKGSDKDSGGFVINAEEKFMEKEVTAVEGCTDSLSYHVFYPGRVVMSCMGVTFELAAEAAIEVLINDLTFNLSFDNDHAGNLASVYFEELLIKEFGQEEYNKYLQERKVKYFDLGIRMFKECMEENRTFYLDLNHVPNGKAEIGARMFHKQLLLDKTFSAEELKTLLSENKIKYINLLPDMKIFPTSLEDAIKKVDSTFSLLISDKPYYVGAYLDKDATEKEINALELYMEALKIVSKNKIELLEKKGKIIYTEPKSKKDWNEYLIYQKEISPEFNNYLKEQERKIVYNLEDSKKNKNKY